MISRRGLVLSALGGGALGWLAFRPKDVEARGPFEIEKSAEQWRKELTPEQYYILREHGTERPFSSPLDKIYDPGTYHCAGCDLPLFASEHKFDSRTGWPSFWRPIKSDAIGETIDFFVGYPRREVHCKRCGGHQGHVFEDGPPPTYLRYCINGIALNFKPAGKDGKSTG